MRIKGAFPTRAGLLQPYARVNVYKSSGGLDVARYINAAAVTDVATPSGSGSAELAGGFTLQLGPRTSIYGEVGKLWATSGRVKVAGSAGASVGLRMRW